MAGIPGTRVAEHIRKRAIPFFEGASDKNHMHY